MAKRVRIREAKDCRLITSREFLLEEFGDEAGLERFSEDALNTKMRMYEEGSDSAPQLFETQLLPNAVAAVHSHPEDEIIYVLDGVMKLGNRSLTRGASIFIAANTKYGFQAGPDGLSFLNFRPRRC